MIKVIIMAHVKDESGECASRFKGPSIVLPVIPRPGEIITLSEDPRTITVEVTKIRHRLGKAPIILSKVRGDYAIVDIQNLRHQLEATEDID